MNHYFINANSALEKGIQLSYSAEYQGNNFFDFYDMAIHIGKEIEKKYRESGLKLSEFAKRLNTGTRNIYSIFRRADINGAMLKKISEVLNFDFFSVYQASLKKNVSQIREPQASYGARKISVTIELDGKPETLESWYDTLKRFNAAL